MTIFSRSSNSRQQGLGDKCTNTNLVSKGSSLFTICRNMRNRATYNISKYLCTRSSSNSENGRLELLDSIS